MKKPALLALTILISFGVVEGKKGLATLQENAARNPSNARAMFALTERYCEEDSTVQAVESWKKLAALDAELADNLFIKAKVATYLGLEPFYPQPVSDSMADSPRLSPDGKWIVFQAIKDGKYNIGMMDFYGENYRWITKVSQADSFDFMAPSFAGSSTKLLYVRIIGSGEGKSNLVLHDLTTGEARDLFSNPLASLEPADISPDGNNVVFSYLSPETKSMELAMYDIQNGTFTELTENIYSDRYPRYSSKGNEIVYATTDWLRYSINIMNTRGRVVERVTDGRIDDVTPVFGDNEKKIVFSSLRQGGTQWDIFVLDRRSGHVIPVTFHESNDYLPDISEDGNWVIFASNRSEGGIPKVYVVSLNQSIPMEKLLEKIKEKEENPEGELNERKSP